MDVKQCRGQSYDNAYNIPEIHRAAEARILQQNELAEFVPFIAYQLNLVGMHAASVSTEVTKICGHLSYSIYFYFPS